MRILASSLFALLLVTACDSGSKPKENPDDALAKKKADEDADAKKIAERAKKREADAAAKVKADEERKQALVTLCVVPEGAKKPKKLDKACEDLAQAQMDYFARQYADQPETLEKMKLSAPLQKANMLKLCTSIDIAVGLKNAFDKAPVGFVDSTNDLIATCIQKLGDGAGAESAMPGKKPK